VRKSQRLPTAGEVTVMQVDIVVLPDEELCAIATVSFTKIQRNTDHGNGMGTENG
jgi:hypothetical protein